MASTLEDVYRDLERMQQHLDELREDPRGLQATGERDPWKILVRADQLHREARRALDRLVRAHAEEVDARQEEFAAAWKDLEDTCRRIGVHPGA